MSDLIEQLWPAFEAEVNEQLEQLEQMLARDGIAAEINFLFRQFHTIKSSSAMMEFHGMEAIAHAAEDLLDLVRRGEKSLQAEFIALLLRAVDTLRRQMAEAMRDRSAPQADPVLVEDLRALVAGPIAAPAKTATEKVFSAKAPAVSAPAAVDADSAASNTDADEMQHAVDSFLSATRQQLPGLVEACATDLPLPADLDVLAALAESAGLLVITRLLHKLMAAEPEAYLELLEELLHRLRHIEALSAQDAGCDYAYFFLRQALGGRFRETVVAALAESAQALETAADAERCLATVLPLRHCCRLLGLAASDRLLGLIMQVLREIARDGLYPGPSLGAQLSLALGIVAELPAELVEDAPYVAMTEQLLENIQHEISYADDIEVALDVGAEDNSMASLDFSADMQAVLSHSVRAQLAAHLAAGHLLVEIDADMEAMSDGGEAFIAWLSTQGTQLANHTVFYGAGRDESTQLRFLAAFEQTAGTIAAGISELDPEGIYLQLRLLNQPAGITAPDIPLALASTQASRGSSASTVRIDSTALDGFVNRVGEIVMLRNMMSHSFADDRITQGFRHLRDFIAGKITPTGAEREQLLGMIDLLADRRETMLQGDARLQEALSHLQSDVLALRVVPVGGVFNRMTRVVWSLAQAQGKQVQIDIRGEETRIDKGMVDILAEPLSHMVRNAIDHGIELPAERNRAGKPAEAVLTLAASQQGNALVLTVADDGRGLDLSRILAKARSLGLATQQDYSEREITDFIFVPGFSTSEQVTSVSGRGVGMDVVKTRITQIGGQIDVVSRPGQGVTFTLRLPLSVALQNVVLVQAAGRLHALPERQVHEVLRLPATAVQTVQGQATCLLRGVVLPLYALDQLLGMPAAAPAAAELEVVVFSDGRHRIGLVVQRVVGRQELFVRDIHPDILRLPGVGGASILGDGSVVVIADGDKLMELARRQARTLPELLRA
ncbi:MAG: chemotaxis protein CheW [Moraxellaceae bacterium]